MRRWSRHHETPPTVTPFVIHVPVRDDRSSRTFAEVEIGGRDELAMISMVRILGPRLAL